jgi:hypothetical protein
MSLRRDGAKLYNNILLDTAMSKSLFVNIFSCLIGSDIWLEKYFSRGDYKRN